MKSHPRSQALPVFIITLLTIGVMLSMGSLAAAAPDGSNPRSDTWRGIRQGQAGETTSASRAHTVLIQSEGQLWRSIRNGPLASIAPWILGGVIVVIGVFYLVVGQDKLEAPRTGIRLKRFSAPERVLHWVTAVLFILLALSGLSLLFGRAVMIPVFGKSGFAAYMQAGMWIHNVCGPIFLAGVLVEFLIWARHNIPRPMDFRWFKSMGGMLGKGPRPHAGKVNGGEKAWFWLMVLSGIGVGVTGVILDFPIWEQSRQAMQLSHVIHATIAVLFVAASFGHIYIGTIGAEGTFEGMWTGTVDAAWAKQHQDLWYEKRMKGREDSA